MSTRGGDARSRLQDAALRLFRERGYERTSAAAIAVEAGVTERTFFRYFTDKREVLFAGEATMRDALVSGVIAAAPGTDAVDALFEALAGAVPVMEGHLAFAKPRHDLIAATPALRERELAKLETLARAVATALMSRGVPELRAVIVARAGMAGFALAHERWIEDPNVKLGELLEAARVELKSL